MPWGCLLKGFLGSSSDLQHTSAHQPESGCFNKLSQVILMHSGLTPNSKVTQGTKGSSWGK